MINRKAAIIATIAAIMISIPATFFSLPQAQGAPASSCTKCAPPHDLSSIVGQPINPHVNSIVNPAGSNMTSASNMTGTAGNTTVGAHGLSIHTTNPAARSTLDSGSSIRNVK